jgi:hypothetical protein
MSMVEIYDRLNVQSALDSWLPHWISNSEELTAGVPKQCPLNLTKNSRMS